MGAAVRHPVDVDERIVGAAIGLAGGIDGGSATGALAAACCCRRRRVRRRLCGSLCCSRLAQRRQQAMMSRGVRVMTCPFAHSSVNRQGACSCILSNWDIASSTEMPYQAGSSAQRIRIGLTGLAFAFLLVLLGSIISKSSRTRSATTSLRRRRTSRANRWPSSASRPVHPTTQQQRHHQQEMIARARRALLVPSDRSSPLRRWRWRFRSHPRAATAVRRPSSRACCC